MKTQHFLSALLLLITTSTAHLAKAQNPRNYYVQDPKTFVGGLVGGVNFTQVDGDSYKGFRNIGLNTGVILYARFTPTIAGSIEILYSQKGAKSNGPQLSNGGITMITRQNITLNYAEVPVQINYFQDGKSNLGGGLSYSQLISSKESIETNSSSIQYDETKYPFKKMDLNLILGGQLHLHKGLYAGLRFQYSLLSIRNDMDPVFGNPRQFNHLFALRLMYLFF